MNFISPQSVQLIANPDLICKTFQGMLIEPIDFYVLKTRYFSFYFQSSLPIFAAFLKIHVLWDICYSFPP